MAPTIRPAAADGTATETIILAASSNALRKVIGVMRVSGRNQLSAKTETMPRSGAVADHQGANQPDHRQQHVPALLQCAPGGGQFFGALRDQAHPVRTEMNHRKDGCKVDDRW